MELKSDDEVSRYQTVTIVKSSNCNLQCVCRRLEYKIIGTKHKVLRKFEKTFVDARRSVVKREIIGETNAHCSIIGTSVR